MADTLVRKCEACDSQEVKCEFYKDIKIAGGRHGDKWLCAFCAHTLFGVLLVRTTGNGGFHMDPMLVKGIVQSFNIAVKVMKGEL